MPNADIILEIKKQDYDAKTSQIRRFISEQITQAHANGVVLGLSGGIDSAVLAYICRTEELLKNTLAIIMPDTAITPQSETADAQKIISILGLEYKLIDINPILREYTMYLEPDIDARANLGARIRSDILYYYANVRNMLVLGSSDKSEYLIGYYTKYGDGASDIMPIISLYKLQIREIARHLGIPDHIINKKSSPFLRKGDEAEKEIGATYEEIDAVLWCMLEKNMSAKETADAAGIDISTVQRIVMMNIANRHKRSMPARCDTDQSYDMTPPAPQ